MAAVEATRSPTAQSLRTARLGPALFPTVLLPSISEPQEAPGQEKPPHIAHLPFDRNTEACSRVGPTVRPGGGLIPPSL